MDKIQSKKREDLKNVLLNRVEVKKKKILYCLRVHGCEPKLYRLEQSKY